MSDSNTLRARAAAAAISVLLAAATLTPGAAAQEAKPMAEGGQLEKLLQQIGELPAGAWEARVAQLQATIDAHEKTAADLRKRADKLQKKAAAEDRRAAAVTAEIKRLRSLMTLIQPKPATTQAAPAKAPTKAPPPKAAPAETPAEKPAPAEAMAPPKKEMAAPAPAAQPVSFADHLLPIFEESCASCHDDDDPSGGLVLTSHAGVLEGGSSGQTVVPGDPDGSRLFRLVAHLEKPHMPKDGDQLPAAEIELIKQWIALGAPADLAAAKQAAVAVQSREVAVATSFAPQTDTPGAMPATLPAVPLAAVVRPAAIKTAGASPRAPLLAVCGNRQVLLYHTARRELLGVLPFPPGQVEVLRFTADGRRLLAAGGRTGVRGSAVLYDVETGEIVTQLGRERDTVLAAAISPDQSMIALGGPGKRVHVHATATGERLYEITAHDDFILSLDFSPDGSLLASADRAGVLGVWEAEHGRSAHLLRPGGGALNAVRFRPDAAAIAAASADGNVACYELKEGKRLWNKPHGGAVLGLSWSPLGTLASAGADGRAVVWKPDGSVEGKSPACGDWLYAVAFGHDGEQLFAGDWTGTLHCLSKDAKKVQAEFVPGVPQVSS